MGFFEALIRGLIYICLIALAYFLVVWVLGAIGLALPHMVLTILMVILALVAILVIVRLFAPFFAGFTLFPPPRP